MSHNYKLVIHAECLSQTELNYELNIRKLLQTSDNYVRRQTILRKRLKNERDQAIQTAYSSVYDEATEVKEIEESFGNLKEIYEIDQQCTNENVRMIESLVVHLDGRIERMNGLNSAAKINPIHAYVKELRDSVIKFYIETNVNVSSMSAQNQAQNGRTNTVQLDNHNQLQTNDLVNVIERTVSRLLDQRFPSQQSGNYNPSNNESIDNGLYGCEWYEEPGAPFATNNNATRINDHYRPSSTQYANHFQMPLQRINVREWGFQFTGIDRADDPKALTVETFLQKVQYNGEAEQMAEKEIMSKVHQLLDGPAAEWYAHKRKQINSWIEFKYQLRNRFAYGNTTDAIRQQIYLTKQKPGEKTLDFIDHFINLINRLPERVTEYQRLNYILDGMHSNVSRMARTAGVRSVDELTDYVKRTFGHSDRFEPRFKQKAAPFLNSTLKYNKTQKNVEILSEDEWEYSDQYDSVNECEVGAFPNKRVPRSLNRGIRRWKNHTDQGPRKERANEKFIQKLSPTTKDQLTSPKQSEIIDKSYINPCPYCDGEHSYKDCPLPPEDKQRHCFICKSTSHIAPKCPTKQNSQAQPSSVQSIETKENSLNEIELVLPPSVVYVESVIFFPKDDQRPYLTVKTGNIELTGLIDTGSHATVIGQNLYEANEWGVELKGHDTTIVTADGTKHQAMGILLLPYEVAGKSQIIPTIVLPIVMKKPIFGIDFQRRFGIKMVMGNIEEFELDAPKVQKVYDCHKLSKEQQSLLTTAIETLPVVSDDGVLNCSNVIEHTIDTGDHKPVYSKPYVFSPSLQVKVRNEIQRMIKRGIIKRISESAWLNSIVPVPKPDGTIRVCLNAKKLNLITKKNRHNPTNIERIFARIPKAKYFSSIDLKDAFYQIPLAEKDQMKTAFSVHGLGIFAYIRMPQGLVNSAATLNRLVESMFNSESEPEIFVYVDDFIICTETFERHIELLQLMAKKLKELGLAISIKKSKFCMKRLKFLGHEISEQGISIDTSRIQAINTYKKPTNAKEIRTFLGFTGWHRKFIKGYAELSAPLVNLTRKKVKFEWTEEHEQAFEQMKSALLNTDFLCNPNYSLPFHIDSTSSSIGTSAVLYQIDNKQKNIIAYMSTKLNQLQQKYHPVEKECFALIVALEKFRHYIEGSKVIVTTDQCSLNWLINCKDPTGRIARWSLRLQAYDFELKTRKFAQNEPISIISREIDMISTPSISGFTFTCEEITSYKQSEISVIDIVDVSNSQDDWYVKMYKSIESDPKNEYFKIVGNTLYHRPDKIKNMFENEWKICVPEENRNAVLKEQHDSILASHPGVWKTIRRIQNIYYWPKMSQQINDYVNKCEICRTTKSSNVNVSTQMGQRRETDFPFRTLSVDFVGPVTMSKKRNQYLFVVIDNFTKFVCIKPMRVAKAENVTRFLEDEVFLKYGVCEKLICDNGVQFASKELARLMNKYDAKLKFTPFYYPQANPCEIANKSIVNAIRCYVSQNDNQRIWDEEIAAITCALNCHVHTSTNMSPYYALHGHDMMLKGTDYARIVDVNDMCENEANDRHAVIRQQIRECLYKAYTQIERTNNKRAGKRQIDLSKDTYLKNMKQSNAGERYSKKLGNKFIPVDIVKQLGSNTFVLANKEGKILGNYHSSLLMQR